MENARKPNFVIVDLCQEDLFLLCWTQIKSISVLKQYQLPITQKL